MSEQIIKPTSVESTTTVGAIGGDNADAIAAIEAEIIELSNERDATVAAYREQLLELKAKREALVAQEGEI